MRVFIAAVIAVMLGMAAVVVINENNKGSRGGAARTDESAAIATISTGEAVDIDAHVPRQGLTIVEFTAEF